ncbi:uncharacterized protein K444DRAFT_618608 [Hyaloscypha bicolor E]|uniref:Uncharacterized protein n=1 Tax=Hyaloscypha bicolor E TaxID=1095630 RepID=A0A2J6STR6_9HELO|nr:uncharacterized protein K444DRAFT_618608 [Hyaloscypha bicolor E]PMD54152.1 hypothetical protein K444DRAFT_618608 [Hyaloscypha bicolor E]
MTPRNHALLHQESISIILAVLVSFLTPKATETSPIFNTGHPTPLSTHVLSDGHLIPIYFLRVLSTLSPSTSLIYFSSLKKCAVVPPVFSPDLRRSGNSSLPLAQQTQSI